MTLPKTMPRFDWFSDNSDSCDWRDEAQAIVKRQDFKEEARRCHKLRSSRIYSKMMSLAGKVGKDGLSDL